MSPTPMARFKRNYLGTRKWTRHSLVLIVAGLVYIAIGFVYVRTPEGGPSWLALVAAQEYISLHQWAWVWIFVGLLAIVSARWPPKVETWGYMGLTALAGAWGAFYILGVALGPATIGSVAVGMVWWLVAFLWWAISGLVSPEMIVPEIIHPPPIDEGRKIGGQDGRG